MTLQDQKWFDWWFIIWYICRLSIAECSLITFFCQYNVHVRSRLIVLFFAPYQLATIAMIKVHTVPSLQTNVVAHGRPVAGWLRCWVSVCQTNAAKRNTSANSCLLSHGATQPNRDKWSLHFSTLQCLEHPKSLEIQWQKQVFLWNTLVTLLQGRCQVYANKFVKHNRY